MFNSFFKVSDTMELRFLCISACFLLLITSSEGDEVTPKEKTNPPNVNGTVKCEKSHEFDKLSVVDVLGKWRGVEVYTHLSNEGVAVYKTCPVITLWLEDDFPSSTYGPSTEHQLHPVHKWSPKFRTEHRYIRMLWDEGQTIEYALYFSTDSAGLWEVYSKQNGTMALRKEYQQFDGTIQVLKANDEYLLLNFCQESSEKDPAQQYSALFSRDPEVPPQWEISSTHSLLQNKGLSAQSRRLVCRNSAPKVFMSILVSFTACFVLLISSS